jgi:hypothetical protein
MVFFRQDSDVNVPSGAKLILKVGIISGLYSGRVRFKINIDR